MDNGTSQHVNSPKYLIGGHQTRTRVDTAKKNIATFDISIFKNFILKSIR